MRRMGRYRLARTGSIKLSPQSYERATARRKRNLKRAAAKNHQTFLFAQTAGPIGTKNRRNGIKCNSLPIFTASFLAWMFQAAEHGHNVTSFPPPPSH